MKFVLNIFFFAVVIVKCHVVKRQAVSDIFRDVVRQKTRGNSIQQCPCVIHPESRQCISYDSRYIAVNYEEAILSFIDLSKHHVAPASLINGNTFSCTTTECQQCFSLLYHKLNDIGLIPTTYTSSITPLPQSQLRPSLCPRYNFPIPIVPPAAPSVVPPYLQSLINAGRQFRSINFPRSASSARSDSGSPRSSSSSVLRKNTNNNPGRNNLVSNSIRNTNQNRNQSPRNFDDLQSRQNSNQANINRNNQLQNQRAQFRNNQAMRNRFDAQQRANNAVQNAQRQFQPNQNFQRPWQAQQQLPNPRPFQNFNPQQQLRWNGRFWEPLGQVLPEAIQSSVQNAGNGWSNGWGQQVNSGGGGSGIPQAPVIVQPAPAAPPALPVQPVAWSGGGGNGFGGGGVLGGGWGGGGQNQNNQGFGGFFGGFKKRQKRATSPVVIGQRFTINCMSRGDSENDILSLCGWGECVQQYRNVDVLRRDNGRWVPTVITTSTCCDCRVRAGTEIHSLVIGDKH